MPEGEDEKKKKDSGGRKPGQSDHPNGGGEPPRTFTQDELDAVAAKERKRGIGKGQADLLAELGRETAEELKQALADFKKLKDSQMSEAEKQTAKIEALEKQLEDEKQAGQAAKDAANLVLKRAAVMAEAAKAEHNINEAARGDLWLFVDQDALSVSDDGKVEGAAEAVKAVIEQRPYLVGNGRQEKPPGTPKRETRKQFADPNAPPQSRRPTVRL